MKNNIQAQIQTRMNAAVITDLDLFEQYIGKRVVVEEDLGDHVSVATLVENGADFVLFADYHRYSDTYDMIKTSKTPSKMQYSQNERVVAKKNIASIQTIEDVLSGRPCNDIFEGRK